MEENKEIDYIVTGLTEFSATQVTVIAVSDVGKLWMGYTFGTGCVSVNIPKSRSVALIANLRSLHYNLSIA